VGVRSLAGDVGDAIAFWDVGVRSLVRDVERCVSVALLQAVRCWGCMGCVSVALLQAVRCLGII